MLFLLAAHSESGVPVAKRIYMVDTENIGSNWKYLLPQLGKYDKLLLFYTVNSPYLSYPDLKEILSYPDSFEMIQCYTGNNGLDFQLVSYMGYLMKTATKTEYVIVSNDTGYDPAVKFWRDRERLITRISTAELLKQSRTAAKAAKAADKSEDDPAPAPSPVVEPSTSEKPASAKPPVKRRRKSAAPRKGKSETPVVSSPAGEAPSAEPKPEAPVPPAPSEPAVTQDVPKEDPPLPVPEPSDPVPNELALVPVEPLPEEESDTPSEGNDAASAKKLSKQEKQALLRETLPDLSQEAFAQLYQIIQSHNLQRLSLIYNQLVRHFGQELGLEYYRLLKPVLPQYYNN
jgi:hypothetical protein